MKKELSLIQAILVEILDVVMGASSYFYLKATAKRGEQIITASQLSLETVNAEDYTHLLVRIDRSVPPDTARNVLAYFEDASEKKVVGLFGDTAELEFIKINSDVTHALLYTDMTQIADSEQIDTAEKHYSAKLGLPVVMLPDSLQLTLVQNEIVDADEIGLVEETV